MSEPTEHDDAVVETPVEEHGPEPERLRVRKTYKLFIGGGFPRSESGRSYPVTDPYGQVVAHASQASRKDVRDAVVAARKAVPAWSGATAYNRGQVIYRIAEMLDGRRDQFAAELAISGDDPNSVDAAVDRIVWYAGWADKFSQVVGGTNPVAGPYFNFSIPEPTGVVAVMAPQVSSLLGFVSVVLPVIVTGNTIVVVASQQRPLPAISLAEVLATSDLPGGVVNVLTGFTNELAPWLASHRDVNAIDLTGIAEPDCGPLQEAAADNVKRVHLGEDESGWASEPGLGRLRAFVETKTVWHPIGV